MANERKIDRRQFVREAVVAGLVAASLVDCAPVPPSEILLTFDRLLLGKRVNLAQQIPMPGYKYGVALQPFGSREFDVNSLAKSKFINVQQLEIPASSLREMSVMEGFDMVYFRQAVFETPNGQGRVAVPLSFLDSQTAAQINARIAAETIPIEKVRLLDHMGGWDKITTNIVTPTKFEYSAPTLNGTGRVTIPEKTQVRLLAQLNRGTLIAKVEATGEIVSLPEAIFNPQSLAGDSHMILRGNITRALGFDQPSPVEATAIWTRMQTPSQGASGLILRRQGVPVNMVEMTEKGSTAVMRLADNKTLNAYAISPAVRAYAAAGLDTPWLSDSIQHTIAVGAGGGNVDGFIPQNTTVEFISHGKVVEKMPYSSFKALSTRTLSQKLATTTGREFYDLSISGHFSIVLANAGTALFIVDAALKAAILSHNSSGLDGPDILKLSLFGPPMSDSLQKGTFVYQEPAQEWLDRPTIAYLDIQGEFLGGPLPLTMTYIGPKEGYAIHTAAPCTGIIDGEYTIFDGKEVYEGFAIYKGIKQTLYLPDPHGNKDRALEVVFSVNEQNGLVMEVSSRLIAKEDQKGEPAVAAAAVK